MKITQKKPGTQRGQKGQSGQREKGKKMHHQMSSASFDVIVVGGGTAGLRLGLSLARKGKQTLLVEPGRPGGTCLHTGCIPTKAMLHAAETYRSVARAPSIGIRTAASLDIPRMMRQVRSFIRKGQAHIDRSIDASDLTVWKGRASFLSKDTLRVGRKTVKGAIIVICTGSRNRIPLIKGLENAGFLTNESVFHLKTLPRTLTLIGGGYISMELATFFSSLGTRVTILEALPQVLSSLDEDVRDVLLEGLRSRGTVILTGVSIAEVKRQGRRIILRYRPAGKGTAKGRLKSITSDALLVAAGRTPNTDGLGLEQAGIRTSPEGGIIIDKKFQTTNPSVYAVGDVTGKAMFAHAAKRQARLLLSRIVGSRSRHGDHLDLSLVPWAVFTSPPIAGVGLTEQQATKGKLLFEIYKASFAKAGRAAIIGETEGFIKLIVGMGRKGSAGRRTRQRILGCTIVGPRADELIHEYVAVMNSSSPFLETITRTVHVHPTLAEAAETFRKVCRR
ncbi:MAG: NAD(P)/FAD-dependent oxidoreductase [DPANN group archaeon]|nr:NAD(P)/FAD-dependent oxidoreductase [DPANN group archaeon]